MDTATLIQVAALVGASGAALVLAGHRRLLVVAGLGLLAAAEGALAYAVAPTRELDLLFERPLRIAALVVGVLAVGALTAALVRFPNAVPVILVCVAPFRIPIDVAGEEAFLLVPLYAVLTAACLAFLVRIARDSDITRIPLILALPATLFIGLAALSALWSVDVETSAVELLFFYFPFAALVAVVARAPLTAGLPRALAAVAVGLGVFLGAIGLWQLESHNLFFAHDLERGNAYTTYFRTTSLFHDPSIYGRHLVLAILIVVVALWLNRLRFEVGAALVTFLAAALFFTYSQSSMITLAVGLIFVALLAADRRSKTIILVGALVLALVGAGIVAATARTESLRRVTSGRSDLAANASEIAAKHPVAGVGIGGEERAVRDLIAADPGRLRKVSHTTPLTVAAELGAIGLAAYVAFLAASGRLLLIAGRQSRPLGLGLATVFVCVFVHSLFYSGFFEDPVVWLALALAGGLVQAAPRPAPPPA
jgi:putative inorganic carbon (hco3(-)) transporter